MKSLENSYIENYRFSQSIISSIGLIREYKGKETLYIKQSPDVLEKLLEIAIIQSAESSNRIEGISVPHDRVEKLIRENTAPRNRSEQEVAGYRDVLNLIHQSHQDIPLTENVILQFHSMLYRYTTIKAGFFKKTDNKIVERKTDGSEIIRFMPLSWQETPEAMKKLLLLYNSYCKAQSYDSLILVPLIIFDFLCIHPFLDGNGRIARLLTLLLLYQNGYHVGKYISIEKIIEESKESYYDALEYSSKGWHDGDHDILPWLEYFYGTLIAAYKEFENRVGVFIGKGSKTEQIMAVIERFIMPFSIKNVEEACPNISRDMIRKVLRQMRDTGDLEATSKGRGARWRKKRG
ncbi:MAG: cell filamentation protein Fic [Candidatus Fischerbacteria bacterium RBG_13_37_8]|uniref:Cell filamentation protein Fic n=1 Tax=Candidatus Fischerbacteria bacterium RBG_13_37_8 TaxID=1817863 RepID=A0A1F5V5V4_9BACT|nr:MAG: cell filamentation protein Fic [Candidatus Fischerbacteria bacterium RBG_13_37_8]